MIKTLNPYSCVVLHDERKSVSVERNKLRIFGQDPGLSLLRYYLNGAENTRMLSIHGEPRHSTEMTHISFATGIFSDVACLITHRC